MVMIQKSDGVVEALDIKKTRHSCIRAGATEQMADEIMKVVLSKINDGDSTKKIRTIIYDELHKREDTLAHRYDLKYALSRLDPTTSQFEKYITRLFSYFGYETKHSPVPKPMGHCTDHEIDVFMKNSEGIKFIECKHHFHYYRDTGLDVPMRVWARLQDLQDGFKSGRKNSFNFKGAWVITNTKLSGYAIRYATCKKIEYLAWNQPKGNGLNDYIEKVKAYPLTIVPLNDYDRVKLAAENIIDIKDFVAADPDKLLKSGISNAKSEKVRRFIYKLTE
ncbi:MAG: hypothetical protein K0B02_01020 [DPANN group archaeon]|nr:hypothetical protein [DPANN group archaeon]